MNSGLQHLRWFGCALVMTLCSCGGQQPQQTMMRPAGPMSSRIEGLWWFIFTIAIMVFVIVWLFLAGAAGKRKVNAQLPPELHPDAAREQRYLRFVIVATAISIIILFAILGHSVVTGRYMYS